VLALAAAVALPAGEASGLSASSARSAAADARDYCGGHCNDILPPGENGNATLAQILANRALGVRPAHTDDQLGTYSSLADGYGGLTDADLGKYFDDASFGVPAGRTASTEQPRSDVTIARDESTGVPHVTGTTRSGTEFGAGYAAAQDRLWVMDLFRHIGRGELTGFAGGAVANRQLEQSFWQAAPYTEDELRQQIDSVAKSGPRGKQALADAQSYVDGVNAYIKKAYQGRYFPGEYDLTGHVNAITNAGSIQPFKLTDLVALASVIGALFGSGGGGEVQSALVKEAADAKYGVSKGDRVWEAFRERNDPEAVQTLHDGQSFPYAEDPADPKGLAMPDPGSVTPQQEVYDATGSAKSASVQKTSRVAAPNAELSKLKGVNNQGVLPGDLLTAKHGMSNALVVSGKYTDDGHPVAVFGPQTGYFAPQLLMLEELQGPGISARGAAFAGLNFYVELGRGPDYSWSATSAGQDMTDTYAVKLCNTDGSPAGKDSDAYLLDGKCTPMDRLERADSWSPTLADTTAPGSYKLVMYRTKYGLVQSRATVGGVPVAYTSLRSTYRHEVDSIIGFQELNDPSAVHSPQTFQQAAQDINYTFNWFYADDRHIAYYNSGANPVRPADVAPDLPTWDEPRYAWRGLEPASTHPNSVDQDYYVSWNNKQADDYTTAGFGNGSVHRANLLDTRVKKLIAGGQKISRASLTQAMEDAAVTDLRGEYLLPELLKVVQSRPVTDPQQAAAVQQLQNWLRDGTQRRETSAGSRQYADSDAVKTMDAWWPLLVKAVFQPDLGEPLYTALTGALQVDDPPYPTAGGGSAGVNESIPHKGSSFQFGWYSYLDKDLRAVLGEPVQGGLAAKYCGGGDLDQCRQVLLSTLKQASAASYPQVYPGDDDCAAGDQWCADAIIQRPLGGITDPPIGWQNRPTYQQVVQYQSHR
jgi:acyl-homoserine lactone acylase PvdQ